MRTAVSAAEAIEVCNWCLEHGSGRPNLGPAGRGQFVAQALQLNALLPVRILDDRLPFAAPSAVLVNIDKCARLPTNLILEDCLLQVFEKPECIPAGTDVIGELLVEGTQSTLDVLNLAGKRSALNRKVGFATYHVTSHLRFCSTTSPGRVAKSASSEAIRKRRTSALFPTAVYSCRGVKNTNLKQGIVGKLFDLSYYRTYPLGGS